MRSPFVLTHVPVHVSVTTRAGGVSAAPYDENNLALHVGDDAGAVAANRRQLAGYLGVDRVQFMQQVHGADVAVVDEASDADVAGVDVLVTATRGLAIAVLVADCVPLALVGRKAVAVAHAGRRGLAEGVVEAALAAVRRLDDGQIVAQIGPSICGGCYEVPAAMQAEVVAKVPAAAATTAAGTSGLDLPGAVRAQLRDARVITANPATLCTFEESIYYSHRRDGVTGRFAMVAMLLP